QLTLIGGDEDVLADLVTVDHGHDIGHVLHIRFGHLRLLALLALLTFLPLLFPLILLALLLLLAQLAPCSLLAQSARALLLGLGRTGCARVGLVAGLRGAARQCDQSCHRQREGGSFDGHTYS